MNKQQVARIKERHEIVMLRNGRRLHVICPYHRLFVIGAQDLAGRWKPRTGVWSFDAKLQKHIQQLIIDVFNKQGELI